MARFNVSGGEGGLLGVAVDPRFSRNRYVYVFRTTGSGAAVIRYRFVRRRLRSKRTLFGGISVNQIHNGGRLKFGPARRLYLSTGDSAEPSTAQSSGSRNGKFLALSRRQVLGRGGRPTIVSKGHRNPQGFAFSRRGTLFATEHGSTGCDEVNVIRRGRNYGWPTIRCSDGAPGLVRPLTFYPTSIAPSGATFVTQGGSVLERRLPVRRPARPPHPPADDQRQQRGPQPGAVQRRLRPRAQRGRGPGRRPLRADRQRRRRPDSPDRAAPRLAASAIASRRGIPRLPGARPGGAHASRKKSSAG